MAVLFTGQSGMVKVVQLGANAQLGVLRVQLSGNNAVSMTEASAASGMGIIITGIGEDQDVSLQAVTSLEEDVYVYCFGDQLGSVNITGLLVDRICTGEDTSSKRMTGIAELAKFYSSARAITESRKVTITMGTRTIQGYLTSMRHNTSNPELRMQSFTLSIKTVPDTAASTTGTGSTEPFSAKSTPMTVSTPLEQLNARIAARDAAEAQSLAEARARNAARL